MNSITIANIHFMCIVSRYTVVCCVAQENRGCANYVSILTGTTKLPFSHIHNSVIFYLINPKVAVEVPAYQRRLHTKFEENCAKCFQDMSEQTFKFFSSSFRTFEKITNSQLNSNPAEIWYTCRASKDDYQHQFW